MPGAPDIVCRRNRKICYLWGGKVRSNNVILFLLILLACSDNAQGGQMCKAGDVDIQPLIQ